MFGERMGWLRMKLSRLFRLGRQEIDLDVELRFHFDQLVGEFLSEGMSEKAARAAAKREFGHVDSYREEIWNAWRPIALADFWRSIRLAFRSLFGAPGFALIAFATLSIGVGAYTAMFSLLYSIMLRPLPYVESAYIDRIYRVTAQDDEGAFSASDFFDIGDGAGEYGEVAAFAYGDASLSGPGEPAEYAQAIRVSADFLSVLATRPERGRGFRPEEFGGGDSRVLIISQRCWKNRFGGRDDIVGTSTRVNGEVHEIVGVLPESFNDWRHLGWVDLFRPLDLNEDERADRENRFLHLIGRRDSGTSSSDAAGLLRSIGDRLADDYPKVNRGSSLRVVPLNSTVVDPKSKGIFGMIMGLSGCVLLIACSSLANLNIARTISRTREFAMRSALGATRFQALSSLIFESLILAAGGILGAILVAIASARWIRSVTMTESGEFVEIVLDWRMFLWAVVSSLLSAFACSIAPALFALRMDVNKALKRGSRGATAARGQGRIQRVLVVGQFALAMVLLSGALLFIQGLENLDDRRVGWESENRITGTLILPEYKYATPDDLEGFRRLAQERIESLPGVESVSFSWFAPFLSWQKSDGLVVQGRESPEAGSEPIAFVNGVTPSYFATVGTRLLHGRAFESFDGDGARKVCIINESMASGLFGDESAIGRRIAFVGRSNHDWMEVVGVASNASSVVPDRAAKAYQLYRPLSQEPRWRIEMVAHVSGVASSESVEPIQNALAAIDPDLPIRNLSLAEASIDRARARPGILRDMLSAFALVGLGIASLGIYGVISRTMALRFDEFRIRLALGACSRDILRIGIASGVRLAAIGACVGTLGAVGVSQILATGNPGMRFDSLPALIGSVVVLVSVALFACYLPARLATKANPAASLQSE